MMYNVSQSLVPILLHTILFFICIFSLKSIGVSQYILSPIRNRIWYDANAFRFHVYTANGIVIQNKFVVVSNCLDEIFGCCFLIHWRLAVFILIFRLKWNNLKHDNAIYCNLAISLWIDNTYLGLSNINGQ